MAEPRVEPTLGLVVEGDQPLIAIPTEENGREVVRYFTDETAADAATTDEGIQYALALAGVWSDLDWDEMEATLYRMRHEVSPTPLIDEL